MSRFPGSRGLTNSFAHSCGWIHLVAIVTLALVSAFQVNANLTADARVETLIDVCKSGGEKRKAVIKDGAAF